MLMRENKTVKKKKYKEEKKRQNIKEFVNLLRRKGRRKT